jgi:hypothetical protein
MARFVTSNSLMYYLYMAGELQVRIMGVENDMHIQRLERGLRRTQ